MLSTEMPKTSQPISRNCIRYKQIAFTSHHLRPSIVPHLFNVVIESDDLRRAHERPVKGVPEEHVVLQGGAGCGGVDKQKTWLSFEGRRSDCHDNTLDTALGRAHAERIERKHSAKRHTLTP